MLFANRSSNRPAKSPDETEEQREKRMGRTGVCSVCDGICQSVALVREPSNWRALLDPMGHWKGASGGHRYRIGTAKEKDNWWTVASKDGWPDPWDLIDFNFRTRNPEEVNWYLYHFLGCRVVRDGKNFSFDKAKVGILYTKKNHYAVDVPKLPPAVPVSPEPLFKRGLTWFGAGVHVGGMNITTGGAMVQAFLFNLDDIHSRFWLQIDTRRTGYGAGASIGALAVVVTGLYDPPHRGRSPVRCLGFRFRPHGPLGQFRQGSEACPQPQRYDSRRPLHWQKRSPSTPLRFRHCRQNRLEVRGYLLGFQ